LYVKRKQRNQLFSEIPVIMGACLYGHRRSNWEISAADPRILEPVRVCPDINTNGYTYMADDISYDDEGGFQKHKECRKESEGLIRNLGGELADKAFHNVWHISAVLLCDI